jgi:hypothetical protein
MTPDRLDDTFTATSNQLTHLSLLCSSTPLLQSPLDMSSLDSSDLEAFFAAFDAQHVNPDTHHEEAHYKASKVPVSYSLELPIPVRHNGSTVRYAFGTDGYGELGSLHPSCCPAA